MRGFQPRISKTRPAFVGGLCLFLAGCSSENKVTSDSTVGTDRGVLSDLGTVAPPGKIECNGDCKDFVFRRILLPDDSTSGTIAMDFNNDGRPDNALGAILKTLSSMNPQSNLQDRIDSQVYEGSTLVLLRLQAPDFATADRAGAQVWLGSKEACCASVTDVPQCLEEAKQTCFNGSHGFWIDPTSPSDSLFGGRIKGGAVFLGPSKMTLILPFTAGAKLEFRMDGVRILGTLSGNTIKDGILAGGITQANLDNALFPSLANLLNDILADPTTDATTLKLVTGLFDANKDGKITGAELSASDTVKGLFAPDVDVNGDGQKELSLVLGFEAITATIKSGLPPDAGVHPADAGKDARTDLHPVDGGKH
jgi:hypothetical protein